MNTQAQLESVPSNGHQKNTTGETFVVASKVKAAMKAAGFNSSGDSVEALNKVVDKLIAEACARAGANGRKTVRAHDFLAIE